MHIRAVAPNQWRIYQMVPSASGLWFAPAVEQTLVTLTDEDLATVLQDLQTINEADQSVTAVMVAQRSAAASHEPVDAHQHDVATGEGMPEPVEKGGA